MRNEPGAASRGAVRSATASALQAPTKTACSPSSVRRAASVLPVPAGAGGRPPRTLSAPRRHTRVTQRRARRSGSAAWWRGCVRPHQTRSVRRRCGAVGAAHAARAAGDAWPRTSVGAENRTTVSGTPSVRSPATCVMRSATPIAGSTPTNVSPTADACSPGMAAWRHAQGIASHQPAVRRTGSARSRMGGAWALRRRRRRENIAAFSPRRGGGAAESGSLAGRGPWRPRRGPCPRSC